MIFILADNHSISLFRSIFFLNVFLPVFYSFSSIFIFYAWTAEQSISLHDILCIIVYVTNKNMNLNLIKTIQVVWNCRTNKQTNKKTTLLFVAWQHESLSSVHVYRSFYGCMGKFSLKPLLWGQFKCSLHLRRAEC